MPEQMKTSGWVKLSPAVIATATGAVGVAGAVAWEVLPTQALALAGLLGAVAFALFRPGAVRSRQDPPKPKTSAAAEGGPAIPLAPAAGVPETVLAHAVDTISVPLIFVDRALRLVHANRPAHREFPGLTLRRPIVAGLRSPALLDAIDRVVADHRPVDVEFSLRVPIERHFGATVAPLDVPGPAQLIMIEFRDLSEAKRIGQLRADFVANASHELRTPLAAIRGFIETLQDAAKDDAAARDQFLEIMQTQAGRMARLIDDLLSLSRIELNEHLPPNETVDLSSTVEEVLGGVRALATERGITLTASLGEKGPLVTAAPEEMTQVFQNLVDNAIKYSNDDSTVEIGISTDTAPAKGLVGIYVRDHGIGISRRHLPRLTERFYRVDAAQSRRRGGTGLGLAIVKHILNRHRGTLTIESEEGRGSVFTVWLPAASPETPAARSEGEAATPATGEIPADSSTSD